MRRVNAKLIFFVLIILILAATAAFILLNKPGSEPPKSPTAATETIPTATPIATVDPNSYSDVNVPAGITIVAPPEGANDTYIGSNSNQGSSNSGIYIVEGPNQNNYSSGNGGIYIVDSPDGHQTAGGNGIYIVDNPSSNSSSSGNGIYIVDPPSGSTSSSGNSGVGTLRSGSFSGSNGGMTINVSYVIEAINNTSCRVTMDATLSHGNLSSTSVPVTFSCYGQSGSVSAPSISGSGNTYLGSKTFTVYLPQGQSTTMSLGASWKFNGNYSGQYIDSVNASSSVSVSR